VPAVIAAAMLWSAGVAAFAVVIPPLLTERSTPEHRNELFALQSAIQSATSVGAAVLGSAVALIVAATLGVDQQDLAVYRVILLSMALLLALGLIGVRLLADDRPAVVAGPALRRLGEPAAFPVDPRRPRARLGITIRDRGRFARLVLPGFLISVGAGAVIPFLNLFVKGKFGLDLSEVNAVFALTSLGTVAAILVQPRLARRFGQMTSVVLVQAASIPFLVVLGFSPLLWTVVVAMAVRGSLMNAGNPIFSAFAMETVDPAERATLSAATSVGWQLGWVVGGLGYTALQAALGFEAGFDVCFLATILLYSMATSLYWVWFGRPSAKDRPRGASRAGVQTSPPG
jgi:MFS family permease